MLMLTFEEMLLLLEEAAFVGVLTGELVVMGAELEKFVVVVVVAVVVVVVDIGAVTVVVLWCHGD